MAGIAKLDPRKSLTSSTSAEKMRLQSQSDACDSCPCLAVSNKFGVPVAIVRRGLSSPEPKVDFAKV
jgi:hypothetical protein